MTNMVTPHFKNGGPGAGGQGAGFGGFSGFGGVGDIFEEFFGGGGGRASRPQGPQRGNDLRYDLEITLEEAFTGSNKTIEVGSAAACESCNGSGAEKGLSIRKIAAHVRVLVPCATSKGSLQNALATNAAAAGK